MEIEYIKNFKSQLQNEIFYFEQIINNFTYHILSTNKIINEHYKNFDVNVFKLIIQKNKDTIQKLNNQLKKICKHNVIHDVIDIDYGEKQQEICYCEYCELNF